MPKISLLVQNRNFLIIWLVTIVEFGALSIAMLAQTWYVVDTLDMKAYLGWVIIAATLPRLGLMMFGGVLADRLPKLKILKSTFWMRMLVTALAAFLFWGEMMSIVALILIGALFGILDAFYWPARDALLPSIVPSEELTPANSIMQVTNQVGMIAGPVLGGALLQWLPLHAVFTFTAVLMAIGAMLVGRLKLPSGEVYLPKEDTERPRMLADLKEGFQYILENPVLRILMSIFIVANLLFSGAIGIGLPIIASEHQGMGVEGLSYMQSAFSLGMVVGFSTLISFPPMRNRIMLVAGAIIMEGLLMSLLGHGYSPWLDIAVLLLLGFFVACNNVPTLTLIQQYTERDKLGRVMSFNSLSTMGLAPISFALVSALLSAGMHIGTIMPVLGLTMAAAIMMITLSSVAVVSSH